MPKSETRLPHGKVIADILRGPGGARPMEKHGPTFAELIRIERELKITARLAGDRGTPPSTAVSDQERRAVPRLRPLHQIGIYDADDPRVKGSIIDISPQGVQVAGIAIRPGEVRTFAVYSPPLDVYEVFLFKAECRWSRIQAFQDCVAGFIVLDISAEDSQELDKLIGYLTPPATHRFSAMHQNRFAFE